jgi:hypothetical protein
MSPVAFEGTLEGMPRGGHAIAVREDVAAAIAAKHGTRVRGTLNGAAFRSNLGKMGGRLILGVHKATVEAAGLAPGDLVDVAMEPDTAPRETDAVPPDLTAALARNRKAAEGWAKLAPSRRRELVTEILVAKKAETRERRVRRVVDELATGPPWRG